MEAGAPYRIRPIAPSDQRRLEAGIFNYGNDMTVEDTPLHVSGMERLVELSARLHRQGRARPDRGGGRRPQARRRRVRRRAVPDVARRLLAGAASDGEVVGRLTSASHSFRLKKNIGYAWVPIALAEPGNRARARRRPTARCRPSRRRCPSGTRTRRSRRADGGVGEPGCTIAPVLRDDGGRGFARRVAPDRRSRAVGPELPAHGRADRPPRRRGRGRGGAEPRRREVEVARGRAAARRLVEPGRAAVHRRARPAAVGGGRGRLRAPRAGAGASRSTRSGSCPRRSTPTRSAACGGRACSPGTRAGAPGSSSASSRRARGSSSRPARTTSSREDPEALWSDVLRRKGREYRLMATMPIDPSTELALRSRRPTHDRARSASMASETFTFYVQPWYRKSPYYEATKRHGCKSWGLYNHMLLPTLYDDPVTEYGALRERRDALGRRGRALRRGPRPRRVRAREPDHVSRPHEGAGRCRPATCCSPRRGAAS